MELARIECVGCLGGRTKGRGELPDVGDLGLELRSFSRTDSKHS